MIIGIYQKFKLINQEINLMLLRHISMIAAGIVAVGNTFAITQPNFVSSAVFAENLPDKPLQHRGQPGGWLKDLNLTPQQLEQIKKIRSQSKEKIAQNLRDLRQAQPELSNLIAGTASQNDVRNKYNQIKNLKQLLADAEFENTLAIREILNPAQRQKFVEHMYKSNPQNPPTKN
jgi:protein CpxP